MTHGIALKPLVSVRFCDYDYQFIFFLLACLYIRQECCSNWCPLLISEASAYYFVIYQIFLLTSKLGNSSLLLQFLCKHTSATSLESLDNWAVPSLA